LLALGVTISHITTETANFRRNVSRTAAGIKKSIGQIATML